MNAILEARGLCYAYEDGTIALDGVDFALYPGETVAILGANGSGKTTFVLHLNGLLMGSGTVTVCGLPVRKDTLRAIRAKVGMVFQDSDEQLFMPTVLEDASFGPRNMGMNATQARDRALDALRQVDLEYAAEKPPYRLSAGEKKRAAIAGVLAMDPEILILDEPTTFLDPPGQRRLAELLAGLSQAKLIVTHDAGFASRLATRAIFFHKGRLTGDGPVGEIVSANEWRVDLCGNERQQTGSI